MRPGGAGQNAQRRPKTGEGGEADATGYFRFVCLINFLASTSRFWRLCFVPSSPRNMTKSFIPGINLLTSSLSKNCFTSSSASVDTWRDVFSSLAWRKFLAQLPVLFFAFLTMCAVTANLLMVFGMNSGEMVRICIFSFVGS